MWGWGQNTQANKTKSNKIKLTSNKNQSYIAHAFEVYIFQLQFKYMSKLFLALSFILLAQCSIVPGWPDAIRCGGDNTGAEAATFFLHGGSKHKAYHYRQVWIAQERGVGFHSNGSYDYGIGDYNTRRGCEYKSIADLKRQGRAQNMDNSQLSQQINLLNDQLSKSKQEISKLKQKSKMSDFKDYEQIKQKLKNQIKKELLKDAKTDGKKDEFDFGPRWKISQETTWKITNDMNEQSTKNLKSEGYLTNNSKDSN